MILRGLSRIPRQNFRFESGRNSARLKRRVLRTIAAKRAAVVICVWICWEAARITRHSAILPEWRRWASDLAERTAAEFITLFTMISTGTHILRIQILRTGRRFRKPAGRR